MAYSADGEDFAKTLQGVALLDGEGSIDLSDPSGYRFDDVHIAVVHDGSGFTPGAAIVVMQGWGSEDLCLHNAYEILEQHIRDDKEYMDDIAEDVKKHFMSEHGMSESDFAAMLSAPEYGSPGYDRELGELRDDYWTQVDEWAFETFGGDTWKLGAVEAADIIHYSHAREFIEISGTADDFGKIHVEVANYGKFTGDTSEYADDPIFVYLTANVEELRKHDKYLDYVFTRNSWMQGPKWDSAGEANLRYYPELIQELEKEGYVLDVHHFKEEEAEKSLAAREAEQAARREEDDSEG